jgi:DNA (cytosine-5)-methyltransferase 1
LAKPDGRYASPEGLQRSGIDGQQPKDGGSLWRPTGGFWSEANWIPCIDGKARPVEPGTFPLATGIANRVGLLRGYGNALCAPVAQAFIESYLEVEKDLDKKSTSMLPYLVAIENKGDRNEG